MRGCLGVMTVIAVVTLTGCGVAEQTNIVVVHVFRDPSGPVEPWLSKALHQFEIDLRTTSGRKRILVATAEPTNYVQALRDLGDGLRPALVVLNSRADATTNPRLSAELTGAESLCTPVADCPTFVPSWTSGEESEAAHKLLSFLVSKRKQLP